jgi:hypothetical protein
MRVALRALPAHEPSGDPWRDIEALAEVAPNRTARGGLLAAVAMLVLAVVSYVGVRGGDVILDIDGRVPTSASHALRILGSYQPGEKLKLSVLRTKKRMTFDITSPADRYERRLDGASFDEFEDLLISALPGTPAILVPPPPPPRNDTA